MRPRDYRNRGQESAPEHLSLSSTGVRWIINDYLAIVLNAFPLRERGRAMAIFFAVALVAMPGGKVEERVAEDPEPSQATPGVA